MTLRLFSLLNFSANLFIEKTSQMSKSNCQVISLETDSKIHTEMTLYMTVSSLRMLALCKIKFL